MLNEVAGTAALLCCKRNSLYAPSLQHVVKSQGIKNHFAVSVNSFLMKFELFYFSDLAIKLKIEYLSAALHFEIFGPRNKSYGSFLGLTGN